MDQSTYFNTKKLKDMIDAIHVEQEKYWTIYVKQLEDGSDHFYVDANCKDFTEWRTDSNLDLGSSSILWLTSIFMTTKSKRVVLQRFNVGKEIACIDVTSVGLGANWNWKDANWTIKSDFHGNLEDLTLLAEFNEIIRVVFGSQYEGNFFKGSKTAKSAELEQESYFEDLHGHLTKCGVSIQRKMSPDETATRHKMNEIMRKYEFLFLE